MTPSEFAAKWSASTAGESAGAKEHFIDLCRMLGSAEREERRLRPLVVRITSIEQGEEPRGVQRDHRPRQFTRSHSSVSRPRRSSSIPDRIDPGKGAGAAARYRSIASRMSSACGRSVRRARSCKRRCASEPRYSVVFCMGT